MRKEVEREMQRLLRKYRAEGKPERWIVSWKRGWYMVNKRGESNER